MIWLPIRPASPGFSVFFCSCLLFFLFHEAIQEGKNLILIAAEAFSAEAIDAKRTPTLYRMAEKGIRATEQFFREIGMPTNIKELGIELSDEEIEELARKCSNDGVRIVGGFKRIDRADMVKIYHMARG